jgi:hypothetical protein
VPPFQFGAVVVVGVVMYSCLVLYESLLILRYCVMFDVDRVGITLAPIPTLGMPVPVEELSLCKSTLLGRLAPRELPWPSWSRNWLWSAQSCCQRRMFSTVSSGKFSQYSMPVFLLRTGGEDRLSRSGESLFPDSTARLDVAAVSCSGVTKGRSWSSKVSASCNLCSSPSMYPLAGPLNEG